MMAAVFQEQPKDRVRRLFAAARTICCFNWFEAMVNSDREKAAVWQTAAEAVDSRLRAYEMTLDLSQTPLRRDLTR